MKIWQALYQAKGPTRLHYLIQTLLKSEPFETSASALVQGTANGSVASALLPWWRSGAPHQIRAKKGVNCLFLHERVGDLTECTQSPFLRGTRSLARSEARR